jgi:hypothetical protein
MGDDLLTIAQVRRLLGDRYARVCGGGACVPLDVDGRVMYHRPMIELGLRKDLALHPGEGRRPPVVSKAYGRPAPPPADDFYATVWTEEAARQVLGRDAYVKAIRSRSLRPAAVRAGVRLFRKADVRAHLPSPLVAQVRAEVEKGLAAARRFLASRAGR